MAAGFSRWNWSVGLLVVGLLVLLFFRDPRRHFAGTDDVLSAPADGKVLSVDVVEDPAVGPGRFRRVVTFLNVFDVHVQRVPGPGQVVKSELQPGAKVAAYRPDAGVVNEQQVTVLRRDNGDLIGVRQIAGLVARRVVGYLHAGDRAERGRLLGVIKFGSRVDLLVPETYEILVRPGDRVRNGETPMARLAQVTQATQAVPSTPVSSSR